MHKAEPLAADHQVDAANRNTHPYHILAQMRDVLASHQPSVLEASRMSNIKVVKIVDPAVGKKEHAVTKDAPEHAGNTNNQSGSAAEPPAATQDGPQATGAASAGSDSHGDTGSGVTILSHLLSRGASELDEEIARLRAERSSMKITKKRIAGELRNTERKRARLKTKAKQMSTQDLLEVYAMRMRETAKREPKAKAATPRPVPAAAGVSKK